MTFFFSLLILIINYNLYISSIPSSDGVMKVKDFMKLEQGAKTLACAFLSNSTLLSNLRKNRQIKELLKKNKKIIKGSETKEKVTKFLTGICYTKITPEIAKDVLMGMSEEKLDLSKEKEYIKLFEYDENKSNLDKFLKTMNEIEKNLKELQLEDESLHKNNKGDLQKETNKKDYKISNKTIFGIILSFCIIIIIIYLGNGNDGKETSNIKENKDINDKKEDKNENEIGKKHYE